MRRKCLVLCSRSLLSQGVASLLSLNPTVEVALADLDLEDPVKAFRAIKPEVVMVDISEIEVVEKPFWTFLQEKPQVKLVCLDSRSNSVIIIHGEARVLKNAQELFTILEDRDTFSEIIAKGGKR